jgi:hypothetical protein
MQRKLYKKEERGLKGGPNYQVSEMIGSVTSTGYWPDSPDRNNDFNIIPSNEITMEGMDIPLMGMDNLGNTQYMTPGNNYTFPGSYVTETPIAKQGGIFLGAYKQVGGELVPYDTDMGSFQKGGEPIYVESKNDPQYIQYLKDLEHYNKNKAIYEEAGKYNRSAPPGESDYAFATYDDYVAKVYKSAKDHNYYIDPHLGEPKSYYTAPPLAGGKKIDYYLFRKPTPVIYQEPLKLEPKGIFALPTPKPLPIIQKTLLEPPVLPSSPYGITDLGGNIGMIRKDNGVVGYVPLDKFFGTQKELDKFYSDSKKSTREGYNLSRSDFDEWSSNVPIRGNADDVKWDIYEDNEKEYRNRVHKSKMAKGGSLPKAQLGDELKKQAANHKLFNEMQSRAWDPNETYGYQEEPLNYNPKTGEYTNYKGEVVRVETKPMVIGNPKGAPKKSKAQIEQEKASKYNKQTKADPTLWLQEHPEYMLDENGNPVLRSMMQTNAPEAYLTAEQKNLKDKFIKEQNADPFQQSLGSVTDNPQTVAAATRFANTELAGPLLEKNPRDKYATRAEWIESFTPQERAIIQGSNKAYEFDPALSTQFARALQTEGNKNSEWQRNLDLTEEEKNRPVTGMERLGLFAPLAYPVHLVTGAMTGDFVDAAGGYTPKPLFGDDNTMRDYYQPEAQAMGNALFQAGIDPLNYIGAGLLEDVGAPNRVIRGIQNTPDINLSNVSAGARPLATESGISNALRGTSSVFDQVIGELLQGRKNRKAIAEGNEWLSNWINHPTTQGKIDADMGNNINQFIKYYAGDNLDKQIEVLNLMKNQSKNFKPNSKEYPLLKQIIDNVAQYKGQKIQPIHNGNWGVSYQHGYHPLHREAFELGTKKPNDRYGSWISRTIDLPYAKRSSTVVHEGTHDWVSDLALTHSGLRDKIFANMNPTIKADYIQWKNLRNQGINPETEMGKQRAYMAYLGNPTEQHARIMELRKGLGLKPDDVVTPEYAKQIMDWVDSGGSTIDPNFLKVIDKDPKKLANLFNDLWVAAPAVGVGAAALQQEKKGGGIYLGAYKQVGGQLAPYDISDELYRAPKIVRQEGREYYDPMTETIYMQSSYPNYAYEQAVKKHEMAHHQQKLKGKFSSTKYWPGPLKEPALGSTDDIIYPYYNRTTQDVYNIMNSVPQSTFFGIPEDVAVMGFQDKAYDTPGTAEYEAEQMVHKQKGGDMPFGLPLKEQNIYTLPEYNQPRNPMTGEILPDPQRPNLGMDTGATEYKYTYGFDDGDVDVPSIVAGQYIGDQALDRYRLTGERFKTMADPGSYSKFYNQIGQLGLMQEKHGGAVKKVKIKSLPKNWKSQ